MNKYPFLAFALLAFSLVALGDNTRQVEIQFEPPTERADGSALSISELSHYALYCRTGENGRYPDTGYEIPAESHEGVHTASMGEIMGEDRTWGAYSCVLTSVDTEGRESEYSNEVQVDWIAPPKAPTDVLIIEE